MKKRIIFFLLSMVVLNTIYAQQNFTLSGTLKEKQSGETLGNAMVIFQNTQYYSFSNDYGFYSITAPEGTYYLKVSQDGYEDFYDTINLNNNITKDFEINSSLLSLDKVVLKIKKQEVNVQDTKMSNVELDVKQIKKLPALFGEVDVIKNIQMLPGVQVAGEGNTGLYVRGGGADQNLILMDEAPVYNPAHIFGVFSVFNADVLKSAEIYKGGIPSQYGGRLSSLLDIRTRDGDMKKFHVNGGVGLIASRLTVQGPIAKDKMSFIVSGRRTYADMFLKTSSDPRFDGVKLYFYDLNAKVNYKINNNNRVFVAGYFGRDILQAAGFGLDWGNSTGTVRWNHIFGSKLFLNTTFVYSDFDYGLGVLSGATGFRWGSNLKETTIKQDYSYYINNKNDLSFGWAVSYKSYLPGKLEPKGGESIFKPLKLASLYSMDEALYVSNKQTLSEKVKVEYGLRYSFFQNIGPDTLLAYNGVLDDNNISDSIAFGKLESIKNYSGLEPRLSVRFLLSKISSIKASYNRMIQYQHLLSNSSAPLPTSQWIPSTPYIAPQKADQVALGYFRNLKNETLEASAETYYKYFSNVVDFKDNADIIANRNIETEIERGIGWSYGMEFFLRKKEGRFTGWISYTLSKTELEIPGVNNGKKYYASYDRRHNLNIVMSYDVSKYLNISGNWIYGSGKPITLPVQKYAFDNNYPAYISGRNNFRIAPYHRFDLSATIYRKKEDAKNKSSWNISLYNVYARKNPFTVFVRDKNVGTEEQPVYNGSKEIVKLYLFTIIPSVTYNFNF